MKKLLLFLFVMFATGVTLIAQPQVFFGGGVGGNFSKLKFNDFSNEYSRDFNFGKDYISSAKPNIQGGLRAGIKMGEKFSILLEPSFFLQKFEFKTGSATKEIVRKEDNDNKPIFTDPVEGNRSWSFNTRSVHIPLMARYNLFGDRFGMHVLGGFSLNYSLSGDYTTSFIEIQPGPGIEGVKVNNNPIYRVTGGGNVFYSEEYPANGDNIKFGKSDLDNFNKQDIALILGLGTFYNLNDDGTLRLTFDLRFDSGQTNMYSKSRIDYLSTVKGGVTVPDIVDTKIRHSIAREPVTISGKQRMRSTVLTIGIEFCPSCGF
jgi:hypothetical protein